MDGRCALHHVDGEHLFEKQHAVALIARDRPGRDGKQAEEDQPQVVPRPEPANLARHQQVDKARDRDERGMPALAHERQAEAQGRAVEQAGSSAAFQHADHGHHVKQQHLRIRVAETSEVRAVDKAAPQQHQLRAQAGDPSIAVPGPQGQHNHGQHHAQSAVKPQPQRVVSEELIAQHDAVIRQRRLEIPVIRLAAIGGDHVVPALHHLIGVDAVARFVAIADARLAQVGEEQKAPRRQKRRQQHPVHCLLPKTLLLHADRSFPDQFSTVRPLRNRMSSSSCRAVPAGRLHRARPSRSTRSSTGQVCSPSEHSAR